MPAQGYGRGMVDTDDRVHAVIRRFGRRYALCRRETIYLPLDGVFSLHGPLACPRCVAAIKTAGQAD
jgi:hypothetical protein